MTSRFLIITLFLVSSVGFYGESLAGPSDDNSEPLNILWEEPALEIHTLSGVVKLASTSFSYDGDPHDLEAWFTPSISGFVTADIRAAALSNVRGPHTLDLVLSIPAGTRARVYSGTVNLRSGNRTIPQPLPIKINVDTAPQGTIPVGAESPSQDRIVLDPESGNSYLRDEVIVVLAETATEADLVQLVTAFGGRFYGSIPGMSMYQTVFPDIRDAADLDLIVHGLDSSPITEFAQRAWMLESLVTTPRLGNDPTYFLGPPYSSDVWDESNPSGRNSALEFAKFPSAWSFNTGSSGVVIAVIDDSFDPDHEDLLPNVRRGDRGIQRFTHGTMVAGVVGAAGDNRFGITGAMWDVALDLYAIGVPQFLNPGESTYGAFDTINAINDAIDAGAQIINLSIGWKLMILPSELAFRWALSRDKARDVLFVIAAGNDPNGDIEFPAKLGGDPGYPHVISVSYTDVQHGTEFTQVPILGGAPGSSVNVAAPGCVFTTLPGNGYIRGCGSSYAAPLVAGLAGLLLVENPNLTAADLKQRIVQGANEGGPPVVGQPFHVINAARSLELAANNFATHRLTASGPIWARSDRPGLPLPIPSRLGETLTLYWDIDATVDPIDFPTEATQVRWDSVRGFGIRTSTEDLYFVPFSNTFGVYENEQALPPRAYSVSAFEALSGLAVNMRLIPKPTTSFEAMADINPEPLDQWATTDSATFNAGYSIISMDNCGGEGGQCSSISAWVTTLSFQAIPR